jgi:deoxycytidylate deaminase
MSGSTIIQNFENINDRLPIIGFTGAIGSGCTFHAKLLEEFKGYKYYSLSELLHKIAKENSFEGNIGNLQEMGDFIRRTNGNGFLAEKLFENVNAELHDINAQGIIIDGVKNKGEVDFLRTFKGFYLFSMQTDKDIRCDRLVSMKKVENKREFEQADNRDKDEKIKYGQQITQCTYISDIVINNNEDIAISRSAEKEEYFNNKILKYIDLIEKTLKNESKRGYNPSEEETMMMIAYVESKKSRCLKRKVGAVITTNDNRILSTGYNDVPEGSEPCLDKFEGCYRDRIKDEYAKELKHCPNCGEAISIDISCKECEKELDYYTIECPDCGKNPLMDFQCAVCGVPVFEKYLPGKGSAGKLLDLCRSLHAEERAILNLTRNGVLAPEGSMLYSTTFPCNLCANKIVTTNIDTVIFNEPYPMKEAKDILENRGINMTPFEGVKSSAYFKLY